VRDAAAAAFRASTRALLLRMSALPLLLKRALLRYRARAHC